jgi:hypothetical protein
MTSVAKEQLAVGLMVRTRVKRLLWALALVVLRWAAEGIATKGFVHVTARVLWARTQGWHA